MVPYNHQCLVLWIFLSLAILVGVQCFLATKWIFIHLMMNDIDLLFMFIGHWLYVLRNFLPVYGLPFCFLCFLMGRSCNLKFILSIFLTLVFFVKIAWLRRRWSVDLVRCQPIYICLICVIVLSRTAFCLRHLNKSMYIGISFSIETIVILFNTFQKKQH